MGFFVVLFCFVLIFYQAYILVLNRAQGIYEIWADRFLIVSMKDVYIIWLLSPPCTYLDFERANKYFKLGRTAQL